jgi:FMN phosphatase YigB (HAD superfamily)
MRDDSRRWLVCFDLGGVLVDITTWAQASRDAGMKHRVPLAADDVQRELVARLDLGAIDFESWAQAMANASLGAYSAEEVKRVHHALSHKEHPGAWALVTELHNLGIATACLSNTNFAHWMRLVHRDGDRPLEGQ